MMIDEVWLLLHLYFSHINNGFLITISILVPIIQMYNIAHIIQQYIALESGEANFEPVVSFPGSVTISAVQTQEGSVAYIFGIHGYLI